jgi:hypothetical protein
MFRAPFKPSFAPRGSHPRPPHSRRSLNFNDDAQQQQQTPNAAWGKKNQEAYFSDRANTVLRSVFPCNKSSCKQLVVALDPGMNFLPSVTLCKPGARGVTISREAWTELMQNREKLTRFFKSAKFDHSASSICNLDASAYVEFPNTTDGEKLASIVCDANSDGVRSAVSFKETTWQHIVNLEPLVSHLLTVYAGHTAKAVKIFKGLAHVLFSQLEYVDGRETQETLDLIPDILKNCNPEVYHQDTAFDNFRACEEIKLFCIKELLEECKKAEQQ